MSAKLANLKFSSSEMGLLVLVSGSPPSPISSYVGYPPTTFLMWFD